MRGFQPRFLNNFIARESRECAMNFEGKIVFISGAITGVKGYQRMLREKIISKLKIDWRTVPIYQRTIFTVLIVGVIIAIGGCYTYDPVTTKSGCRPLLIINPARIPLTEGQTFVGYAPVIYERDIYASTPVEEITTGVSISEGVEQAEPDFLHGVYPNEQAALDYLKQHSSGSRVTIFIEDGGYIYRVHEEMLEVGIFHISEQMRAERIAVFGHTCFQNGEIESGLYHHVNEEKEGETP